jgi:uncharacterized membrane protein
MSAAPFVMVASAIATVVSALAFVSVVSVGKTDTEVRHETLMNYCKGVATWEVEKSRGVEPQSRLGQPDYKNIAAESCPGLRPAQ